MTGPEFLVFYATLCAAVLIANWYCRNSQENGRGEDPPRLTGPYEIACLRGGKEEAARLAILNLIQAGLLAPTGNSITTASRGLPANILETAERLMLEVGRQGVTKATEAVKLVAGKPEMKRHEDPLVKAGLIPGAAQKAQRWWRMAACLVLLWGLAGARIYSALSRGRNNVVFLVVLAFGAAMLLLGQTMKPRTRLGDRALAGLRELFGKDASYRPAMEPNEVAMLAAVWGMSVLMSRGDFLFVPTLFPGASSSSSGGCGSSCGSSCGSGGSCGSGCGGCGGD